MLTIRNAQMETLSRYMLEQAANRLAQHLRANFPDHTELWDEPTMQELVRLGLRRAADHGIRAERDIRRYLEYMVLLSPGFDTDPATAWAGVILRRRDLNGSARMRRIDAAYLFQAGR